MIEMYFPSEEHDFFHISHERAGNDIIPSLLIPVSSGKFPFRAFQPSAPLQPGKGGQGDTGSPPPNSAVWSARPLLVLTVLKGYYKVSLDPSLLQAEQFQLCQPSLGDVFQPLITFVTSSGLAPTGPQLSCAEGSRAGHWTPGGVSHSATTKLLSEICANPELQQSSLSEMVLLPPELLKSLGD